MITSADQLKSIGESNIVKQIDPEELQAKKTMGEKIREKLHVNIFKGKQKEEHSDNETEAVKPEDVKKE